MARASDATDDAVVEVAHVAKSYGPIAALADASLTVRRGEILGLLGRNGAGKSTLIGILAGVLKPDRGSVRLLGREWRRDRRLSTCVGYAPQELGIYPTLTVRHNLELFGRLYGLCGPQLSDGIAFAAEALGLSSLWARQAGTLSGGEKRRLHTATAIVHRPPIILLDEPTVGADVEMRGQLLDAVRGLAHAGATIIYTTHYLAELEALAATIAVLDAGTIIGTGSLAELVQTFGRELQRPTLESVYLEMTGPRLDARERRPVHGG